MSPIANQNIGKLHHYNDAQLNTEFDRIYDFLAFGKFPEESIDGGKLARGSVQERKLILPLSRDAYIDQDIIDIIVGSIEVDNHIVDVVVNSPIVAQFVIDTMQPLMDLKQDLLSYILVRDEKANGINGGTFTNGAWRTRDLNAIVSDDDGLVLSLLSNQITLTAGTYKTLIRCPAFKSKGHTARLFSITDSAVVLDGGTQFMDGSSSTNAWIQGFFTIAGTTILEVQHSAEQTQATDGFGIATPAAAPEPLEIYTEAEFLRIPPGP